jgi:D-lactate dehydrogenase (cytochrome)
MFIPSLKALLHNGPRLFLTRSGPLALIVPRYQAAHDATRSRRRSPSADSESETHSTSRNHGKRSIRVRLFLSSLASGLVGYTVAQTTGEHWHFRSIVNDRGARDTQYGTSEDMERAIKALRSAFLSRDAAVVTTDADDLRAHGISQWDHRTGEYDYSFAFPPWYLISTRELPSERGSVS